jgi:hypothetical protein
MNLQAIGVDGVTITYFLATGTGTDEDPIISGFDVNNWPSSYPVTGTFWPEIQPVSAASLPLPTDAATATNQTETNAHLSKLIGFSIPPYNRIEMIHTGTNLTGVVYKLNGSVVATLALTYSGSLLTSVEEV